MADITNLTPLPDRQLIRDMLTDKRQHRLRYDHQPDSLTRSNTPLHNLQRGKTMPKISAVATYSLPDATRGRAAVVNPYTEVIGSFNDGKTRLVKCEGDEKANTEISRLRAAAKTLTPPRGVRAVLGTIVSVKGKPDTFTTDEEGKDFAFKLIEFVARVRKPKPEEATVSSPE